MPPAEAIQTVGHGPKLLFIHGTATDKSMWRVPIELLRERMQSTAYDRRGAGRWSLPNDRPWPLVRDHVDDAADLILSLGGEPMHVCALSFGAVVALELALRRPELVRSAVLFEPALSGSEDRCPVPRDLLEEFERRIAAGEPECAAEYFCRRSLGDLTWGALPLIVRRAAMNNWRHIRADLLANAAHRVRYGALRAVHVPVLLLQGGRSRAVFEPCLRTLAAMLPRVRWQRVEHAAHLPSGSAWPEFAALVESFVDCIS